MVGGWMVGGLMDRWMDALTDERTGRRTTVFIL